MNIEKIIEKIKSGELYPSATDKQIKKIENEIGVLFPHQYADFLKVTNGLMGNHFYFEKVEDLPEISDAYEMKKWMPNWLIIGSDGGGYAILLNLTDTETIPYLCEYGSLFEDCVIKQANSLFDWLNSGIEMIYDLPNKELSSEQLQRNQEVDFKRLVKKAMESFKKKDYQKSADLFTQAQEIKELENKLHLKYLEFAKKHL